MTPWLALLAVSAALALEGQTRKILVEGNASLAKELESASPGARIVPVTPESALREIADADALNILATLPAWPERLPKESILTPHPGEMARLCGCTVAEVLRDRINLARRFAQEHECIVVLKGHRTLIAEPGGEIWVNTTGNPGMATGGKGT